MFQTFISRHNSIFVSDMLVFFFQAEDGIRHPLVTGVQTCALPIGTALCSLALALLYSRCVAAPVARAHGPIDVARVVSYAIIVQMTILAILFVARRPSADTSDRPLDWAIGIGGTFLPLLLRRIDPPAGLAWLGGPMQLVGASAVAVAAVFLGRSFGLVAANRGVQLGGAYRLVRHPMYGAHALGYLGYVLTYPRARTAPS